jgi:hypothetical protein
LGGVIIISLPTKAYPLSAINTRRVTSTLFRNYRGSNAH